MTVKALEHVLGRDEVFAAYTLSSQSILYVENAAECVLSHSVPQFGLDQVHL